MSNLVNNAASFGRKHTRLSVVAGSAAAAGMIGMVGISVGAAPWGQAAGSAARTAAQDGPLVAMGQADAHLALSTRSGGQAKDAQLDALRWAGAGNPATAGDGAQIVTANLATANVATATAAAKQDTASHAAAAKAAAAKKAAAERVAKKAAAKKAAAAKAAASKPYLIYDSVTPSAIPAGQRAAVYVNGSYAASADQVAGHGKVLWIDTNGSDPNANILDVEPGDATPAGAAVWVGQRLQAHPHSVAIVYTMMSDWSTVQADVAQLPAWMHSHVRYWIADPTGQPHVVPGASATQWYWGSGYDITTAVPGFEG
jgi:hypothetical protein